jgi:hypothetical protein
VADAKVGLNRSREGSEVDRPNRPDVVSGLRAGKPSRHDHITPTDTDDVDFDLA